MEKKSVARKIPFKRGDLVVSLASGKKYEFAGMARPGEARVVSSDALKRAVAKMNEDHKKGGMDAIAGDKYKYASQIPNAVVMENLTDLVSDEQYTKAINTPENKGLLDKVNSLESEKIAAQGKVAELDKEITAINKKLFASLKQG